MLSRLPISEPALQTGILIPDAVHQTVSCLRRIGPHQYIVLGVEQRPSRYISE